MFQTLIFFHSVTRWLLLATLVASVCRAFIGYRSGKNFTATDNGFRHWTATISHIQLMIGIVLYTQSPLVKYFWSNVPEASGKGEALFFSLIHIILMLVAVAFITIGSAMAKRKASDRDKFRTQLTWFAWAALIILVAIPWPFSPLAGRPYLR